MWPEGRCHFVLPSVNSVYSIPSMIIKNNQIHYIRYLLISKLIITLNDCPVYKQHFTFQNWPAKSGVCLIP